MEIKSICKLFIKTIVKKATLTVNQPRRFENPWIFKAFCLYIFTISKFVNMLQIILNKFIKK